MKFEFLSNAHVLFIIGALRGKRIVLRLKELTLDLKTLSVSQHSKSSATEEQPTKYRGVPLNPP